MRSRRIPFSPPARCIVSAPRVLRCPLPVGLWLPLPQDLCASWWKIREGRQVSPTASLLRGSFGFLSRGRGRGRRQDHGAMCRGGRRQQRQGDAREAARVPAQPAVAATLQWSYGFMAPKPALGAAANAAEVHYAAAHQGVEIPYLCLIWWLEADCIMVQGEWHRGAI